MFSIQVRTCLPVIACLIGLFGSSINADEVTLKNGIRLSGTAVQVPGLNTATIARNTTIVGRIDAYWMVDDGVRRFFVHRKNIEGDVLEDDDLARLVTFDIPQKRSSRRTGPSLVGGFTSIEPFDRSGWRTVILQSSDRSVPIVQGITQLRPDYVKVEGLTHQWEYCLDTKTIPSEVVQSLIEQVSDPTDVRDRKAIVTFYAQGRMFGQAKQALSDIAADFPDEQDWAETTQTYLEESLAQAAINELDRRREAGQHRLAYSIAQTVSQDRVSASVYRKSQDVVREYELAIRDRDQVVIMLDMLQAEIEDEQAAALRPLKSQLIDELHYDTIDRLTPFLRATQDETLTPDQKLALAYSGWVIGESNAVVDLEEAISLWKARFIVLEILRNTNDPVQDDHLVEQLQSLEYVGIDRLTTMLSLLPPPLEPPVVQPGVVTQQVINNPESTEPETYSVILPPEYSRNSRYPLLVVLRSAGRTCEDEIHWWAGDGQNTGWAQRRGYIVIAPEYAEESETVYDGNTRSHQTVLNAINDIRKRCRIDSDRIFLAGHGMGGDLCFDLGMSQPDWFAGIVPITGQCSRICNYYDENAPHTSWYIVSGERDRNTLDANAIPLNSMMSRGHDVTYCDYKARGYESYGEEQERIFEWMQFTRRPALSELSEWEASSLRSSENQFYWVEARGMKDELFPEDIWSSPRPKVFSGRVSPGGTIYVNVPAHGATVWLSPDVFDFSQRCEIRLNSRSRPAYRDFVKPSIRTMLEGFRAHGDTNRLYWARIEI
ncbi:hypothetical protein AB1L42_07195 [Thalassoglobus sp. JC818]|uniref:carboxylesterase family protein n=1 Tax=Thalassoglobus sp. JC818 TaxID=3232136 RepID=UPI003457C7B8